MLNIIRDDKVLCDTGLAEIVTYVFMLFFMGFFTLDTPTMV